MSLEPSTDRTADRVLVLLLCTDAIVIVIHFLHIGTIYYGSKDIQSAERVALENYFRVLPS